MKRLLLLTILSIVFVSCRRAEDVPKLYPLPKTTLVSQDGRPVSLQAVGGKVAIYDFIFTSCTSTCPLMTSAMKSLTRDIKSPDVRFVSVTVDPTHDSSPVLKEYWKRAAGSEPRWLFLTGPVSSVASLSVDGFKLAATVPLTGDEPLLHSTRFVVVDRAGIVRGYYDSNSDEDRRKLLSDVKALLRG